MIISIPLILTTLFFSVFTVSESEWAIVTQFGKPVKVIKEAGPHVKLPGFFQKVTKFDRRLNLLQSDPVQLILKGQKPLIVGTYIAWRIEDPMRYFQSVGGYEENAMQKLGDMVNSALGITMGDYSMENIINTDSEKVKTTDIENRLTAEIDKDAREKYGIAVEKVGIERIAYPDIVTKAVYRRMKSERDKEASKLRAEGEEEAAKIRSEAKKRASEIEAEAEKKSLILRGEGDREAMKIYGEAFRKDPEFFEFTQSLKMYEKVLRNDTTLIISTDSEMFRFLKKGGKRK